MGVRPALDCAISTPETLMLFDLVVIIFVFAFSADEDIRRNLNDRHEEDLLDHREDKECNWSKFPEEPALNFKANFELENKSYEEDDLETGKGNDCSVEVKKGVSCELKLVKVYGKECKELVNALTQKLIFRPDGYQLNNLDEHRHEV